MSRKARWALTTGESSGNRVEGILAGVPTWGWVRMRSPFHRGQLVGSSRWEKCDLRFAAALRYRVRVADVGLGARCDRLGWMQSLSNFLRY